MFTSDPPWLPLYLCELSEPYAAKYHVAGVARSNRGFLTAYKVASGEPAMLKFDPHSGKHWTEVRRLYVNRNFGAIQKNREKLWRKNENGLWEPSRRHLALVMWAFSPHPQRFAQWVQRIAAQSARRRR